MTITLVYLHGFLSSPFSFKAQLFTKFADENRYKFLALDLYPTADDFRTMTLDTLVQRVQQSLEHLESPYLLIGSSFGGLLSMETLVRARAQLPLPRAVLLLAPAFWFQRCSVPYFSPRDVRQWKTLGFLNFDHPRHGSVPLSYSFYESLSHTRAENGELPSIPITIIHGKFDETVPLSHTFSFQQLHPQVKVVVVSDSHRLGKSSQVILEELVKLLRLTKEDIE